VAAGYASALALEGRLERALTWSWAPDLSGR